jgi:hypothetical protein
MPDSKYSSSDNRLSRVWRRAHHAGRHSLRSLWNAPAANARFLILSGGLWTFNLAITEPYRFLFFSRLGLSPAHIGFLFSADLVIRSTGLLLSGTTQRIFGAKRMLILADSISWVLPYLLLGFSTRPWHAIVAVLLTSLNAFANTPYNCLLAEGMPPERRTKAYAFLNLWNTAPALLVPWFAGWMVGTHEFGPTLRALFLTQSACMAIGIWLRHRHLQDLQPTSMDAQAGFAETARQILTTRGFLPAWSAFATQGLLQSFTNAFLAIYLTRQLHLTDKIPGWLAEIGAVGFALGTLAIQPRLPERSVARWAASALGIQAVVLSAFFLHPGRLGVLAIGLVIGLCSSIYGAATSSTLTSALPERSRAHGFALSFVGVHLTGALFMPLAGQILQSSLAWFPLLAMGILLAWAIGIWNCRPKAG